MHYTVQHVLSIPFMQKASLLSGKQTAAIRPIESVSVIEMPVEDFVKENEFVLTTAIGCGLKPSRFLSFVHDVYEAGASALAVAVGRHVQAIPEEVVQFAQEKDFPLIELPWELRFSDITKVILEQIHQWQQNSLQQTEQIQRKLLQLFIDGCPLQDALDDLTKEFETKVYLVRHDTEPTAESLYKTGPSQSFHTSLLQKNEPAIMYTEKGIRAQVVPLQMFNRKMGVLVLESALPSHPPVSWAILEQTIAALYLWFQKEHSITEKENKDKEEFIYLLAKGEWASWEEIKQQAQSFKINVSRPYVCILGYPENLEEISIIKKGSIVTETSRRGQFSRKIESLAQICAKSIKKQIICSFQRERLIIFLEATEEDVQHTVCTFLDMLEQQLYDDDGLIFSWGIGENNVGFRSFHQSYKDARIALEIGRSHKGPGHRSTYANTGMFRLLSILAKEPSANEMARTIIGSLANYNRERGLDLLHTLASYIQHQGNVTQTSRALSLHRQSLLYRLRKIESLTDRSLEDPDDLFLLQLCLKLWTIRFEINMEETNVVQKH
ncbi:MAG TPA: PucR family transcriptional regulator ligand-binding domain-containing protein [Bacillus sp. (in: firmicutes)]|nr:PucR family transcriptional regulator ligand-binding domain-containing protein [Bacillus sp. (in: firmicutes)]